MIKDNDLDSENEKVIEALSSNYGVFCSGIYDKESLKNNYVKVCDKDECINDELDWDDSILKPIQYILWIDDLIFDDSDTANLIKSISSKNSNINFICSNKTSEGINFLNSNTGKKLLKNKNFRILQDMVRLNEDDKYFAGVNFVKACRNLGIDREIMIFTGNKERGEKSFIERNVSLKNVFVTTSYIDVNKFILGSSN